MSGEESDSPQSKLIQSKKDVLYACLFLLVVLIVFLGFFGGPILLGGHPKSSPHALAVQAAKQWGYALFNFENDYGMYPNEKTAELLKEKYPEHAHLLKTKTSNDFLRQLVVAGLVDGDLAKSLDSEDFKFAYVVGLNCTVDSDVPLLIAPLVKGKHEFDRKYARKHYDQDKRFVILHVDMSITDRDRGASFDWSESRVKGLKPRIVWPE